MLERYSMNALPGAQHKRERNNTKIETNNLFTAEGLRQGKVSRRIISDYACSLYTSEQTQLPVEHVSGRVEDIPAEKTRIPECEANTALTHTCHHGPGSTPRWWTLGHSPARVTKLRPPLSLPFCLFSASLVLSPLFISPLNFSAHI